MIDINHMTFEVLLVSFLTNDVTKEIPIFLPQLLTPHLRYTLEINCRGRTQLISPDGILKQVQPPHPRQKRSTWLSPHTIQIFFQWVDVQVVSTGGDGVLILAQREYSTLTYRSLQPPHDFADRGVDQLPKYFYREHSLMVWEDIHKYTTHTRPNVYTIRIVVISA